MDRNLEDRFGKFLIKGMREEPLEMYESIKKNALNGKANKFLHPDLVQRANDLDSLVQSLNVTQLEQLDRLIKVIVDNAAFSTLREFQEALDECDGTEKIDLRIEGQKVTELDLLSGSLFGEYLLWVEKFSNFGEAEF
ncbi:hypothetical protein [Marinoscillum pacificum]|uniref:hypothetical protein n=1 Tax=Marinoscillum pacificum TaxID=392723 RepID=UPI0021588302|nr:hypothetical protein [Marinoscillum pacificum]